MLVTVRSLLGEYSVERCQIASLDELFSDSKAVFIVDRKVCDLYFRGADKGPAQARTILVEANERNKTLERIQRLYTQLIELEIKKDVVLVGIGGGVVQDIVGFVASTLYRGVQWLFVPTTLLAQADSCIGSKTSVNLKKYKNLLGTFYPPAKILLSPEFTRTLSEADLFSGLGEIVKLAIIDGSESVEWVSDHLGNLAARDLECVGLAIERALAIKKRFIELDEFDRGIRNYLNFGHCFGHAIETATRYRVPHGQAVSLGIICSDSVAATRGLIAKERALAHRALIEKILTPENVNARIDIKSAISAMRKDKKRIGKGLPLIVSLADGSMSKIDDLSPDEAAEAIASISKGKR